MNKKKHNVPCFFKIYISGFLCKLMGLYKIKTSFLKKIQSSKYTELRKPGKN